MTDREFEARLPEIRTEVRRLINRRHHRRCAEWRTDVEQDVIVKAWRFRRGIGDERPWHLRAYLTRVVRSVVTDRLRQDLRRPTVPDEAVNERGEFYSRLATAIDPGEPVVEVVLRAERIDELQALLADTLSEGQAAIVRLVADGHTTKETAAVLGVPEGTVKSGLSRARQLMRERVPLLATP